MRNLIIAFLLLFSFVVSGQSMDVSTGYISTGLTTTQLNALSPTIKARRPIILDTTVGFHVTWDTVEGEWVPIGSSITIDPTIIDGSANPPTGNAVFDALALKANDAGVVHTTGSEDIGGVKNFTSRVSQSLGSGNSFFGFESGISHTSSGNSAFGYRALKFLTSGQDNSAFGENALTNLTTGTRNSAFGVTAMEGLTTGSQNTAMGWDALASNTTEASSTAIGYQALLNSTFSNNTAIGSRAMSVINSGGYNVAMGAEAGNDDNSVAGDNDNFSATNSVFIGAGSKSGGTGSSNEIVIGYTAIGRGSNTVRIGNSSITDNYFTGDLDITGAYKVNGVAIGGGTGDALTTDPLSQFAPTPSSGLRDVLTDEVGTGAAYFVGGDLGTPPGVVLTNATGLPITTGVSGLGTGVATALGVATNTVGGLHTSNIGTANQTITGSNRLLLSSNDTLMYFPITAGFDAPNLMKIKRPFQLPEEGVDFSNEDYEANRNIMWVDKNFDTGLLNLRFSRQDFAIAGLSGSHVAFANFPNEIVLDTVGTGFTSNKLNDVIKEGKSELQDLSNAVNGNAAELSNISTRQDSIVDVLGAVTTSAFTFVTKTSPGSAVLTDAEDNKIIFLDYANESFTIPSGVFDEGHSIRIQSIGSGTGRVVPGSGVSFSPFDAFQLDSITKAITLARVSSATGPEEWFPLDGYIKNYVADPNEGNLLTSDYYGNLAFPSSTNNPPGMVNTTGTISLETTDVFSGTSAMRWTNSTGVTTNFSYFNYPTTSLSVGNSITLTFKYFIVTPGTQIRVALYDPTSGQVHTTLTGSTGVWLDGSVTYTVNQIAAGQNRIYTRGDGVFIVDDLKLILN